MKKGQDGGVNPDNLWLNKYQEVKDFIEINKRNPSRINFITFQVLRLA